MRRAVILLTFFASTLFAQSPCAHSTEFRYVNHRMIVPVRINGYGPYYFLFDTGTQVTIVDPVLVATLHAKDKAGTVSLAGMGVKSAATYSEVDSIELDGHKSASATVVVYDLTKVQDSSDVRIMGILGQNFLEQFNYVINHKTSCVRLFEGYNP